MLRANLWKLILSAVIVLWAAFNLVPLKNVDFGDYVKSAAEAKPAQFATLMAKVSERVKAGQASSTFMALKQIAREDKIDLSQFFPQIRLEDNLKNIEKRNAILLDELHRQSRGRLQLGLDLRGGVAFTLEVDEKAAPDEAEHVRQEKLNKAIEIISERVNGLGVSEPIIRAVSDNRIEVQLASVSTTDNPEVLNSLKKPARLDFRMVHPFAAPPMDAPAGYAAMTLEGEDRKGETYVEELYVKRIPEMTGEAVSDSYPIMDDFGRFKIILRFTPEGSKRFAEVTRTIADEGERTGRRGRLAIVLDDKLYSAPGVEKEIN
ncbi:MAG TPA: protein translocase subunit SecDF, partial [Bacteroidia bacterium]|nr:protein translocase subunit SecDF [Bacteroidia bacterium]